jgi:hypothetical protein
MSLEYTTSGGMVFGGWLRIGGRFHKGLSFNRFRLELRLAFLL